MTGEIVAFTITIDVFLHEVHIIVTDDKQHALDAVKKLAPTVTQSDYAEEWDRVDVNGFDAFCYPTQYRSIIVIHEKSWSPRHISTLAHEVFHAVMNITSSTGMNCSAGNDEQCAYLMGYIMQRALMQLTKRRKRAPVVHDDPR